MFTGPKSDLQKCVTDDKITNLLKVKNEFFMQLAMLRIKRDSDLFLV